MIALSGIRRQRLSLIGYPPFLPNYVPVFLDAAGRVIGIPVNGNIQLGSGTSVIAVTPGVDQMADSASLTKNWRDGYFGRDLYKKAGTSAVYAKVGGIVYQSVTDVSSSGTSETDLWNVSIPIGMLATDGEALRFIFRGQVTTSANSSQLRVRFPTGTVIFDSGSPILAGSTDWTLSGEIVRTSNTAVRCFVALDTGLRLGFTNWCTYIASTPQSLTSFANILRVTGTMGGTGGTNISFRFGRIYHEAVP